MERSESINTYFCFKNNDALIIFIIILFHFVGLVGLSFPSLRPFFLQAVPGHLLLMFLLIILNHRHFNTYFSLFILLISLLGFTAEWIGVKTNLLFGNYYYGNTLGVKFSGTPLIMCANWFLVIYSVGTAVHKIGIKNVWVRIITGSLTLVLLDTLIEPVAMRLDYWHWQNNIIPIMNYVTWFLLSFVMLYLFERFDFKKQNWAGSVLLLNQFVFFSILNLVNSN